MAVRYFHHLRGNIFTIDAKRPQFADAFRLDVCSRYCPAANIFRLRGGREDRSSLNFGPSFQPMGVCGGLWPQAEDNLG